ncbi:hypothetical protein ZIOFF_071126 [Zingiber officinale]|uniref:Serine/threonine-protein phosphatase n=1 Tax=Zingiber officinale TaxID=94328 RepID=A0A8J5CB41_ZINOF|nr:hypothetical protein ZIOFF_071126 [Zingiber officinale]
MANEIFSGRIPTETLAIKFTGKNYATWEFQFRMFLKGKELWGHIDGSLMAPENAKDLGQWETKDARIISWLLGSIEAHMVNNLRPFNTTKEMWDYLKRIYHQDNIARRFQLELEIGNLSQGDLSIEQYYSGFLNLWGEYSNIIYSKVPKEVLASIQAIHEVSKRDQFLMKLRSDFDVARAGLLNRNPVPSLDICLGELLREEQRLATQAVLGASLEKSTVINVAYAAQGRNRGKDQLQCYSCKEFGHIARNCSKKFCNYCKQHGHIIKECPTRPENRRTQAFQATIPNLNVIGPTSTVTDTNQSVLTPEMVQQMILTAFSTLTLQGQGMNISSSWIVDSGASNQMTGSPDLLHNVFLPHRVFLLRGNHESKYCTSVYGFENEVLSKYGDQGKQVYRKCLRCFEDLPLASVIADSVYTAHGGLFRSINVTPSKRSKGKKGRRIVTNVETSLKLGSMEELSKARRTVLDPPWEGLNLIPGDVLWSHEGPDARVKRDDLSGMDAGYTIDHQVESGQLITLFSAPDYPQFQATDKRFNNRGAYIVLQPPHFASPVFHTFEAVKPRPQSTLLHDFMYIVEQSIMFQNCSLGIMLVKPYYDYEEVIDSDEELDLRSMDNGSSIGSG